MPSIGLGTADRHQQDSLFNAIMKADYCHLDTAKLYGNEEDVGEVLQRCFKAGKKREEIHVATKIWFSQFNDVEEALQTSLKKLQLDYVDVYYVHWPVGYQSEPKVPMY